MRQLLLLLLVAATVFFSKLGSAALWDEDEPRNAGCAYEMLQRGDWVVPTFNDELRTHKPIFLYWAMLTAYHLLGVSEFSARVASALMALISVLATYRIGWLLFGKETGFWSAIVLTSSLLFGVLGRAATPDACLIAATSVALVAFVEGVAASNGGRFPVSGAGVSAYYLPWRYVVGFYAALGWAVLAKGPVGCVLPITGLVCFLVLVDRGPRLVSLLAPGRWFRAAWMLRPQLGVWIFAVVAVPWYAAVAWRTQGDWVSSFLGQHNLGRFLHPMESHRGPVFYYVPAILVGMFPWSVFLPIALWKAWQAKSSPLRPQLALCGCWVGVWVACFSLAATKLPNYVVPAYPMLAILIGRFLVEWQQSTGSEVRWVRYGLVTLGAVGMVFAGAVSSLLLVEGAAPIPERARIALQPFESEWPLGLIGLVLCGGAGWALWQLRRGHRQRVLWSVGAANVAFLALLFVFAAPRISRHQDGPWLAAQVRQIRGDAAPLATYEFFASTLVYYNRGHVERMVGADEIVKFLEQEGAMLITRSDRLEQIREYLPAGVTVLARKGRFFRTHDVVLLGRELRTAQGPAPSSRQ